MGSNLMRPLQDLKFRRNFQSIVPSTSQIFLSSNFSQIGNRFYHHSRKCVEQQSAVSIFITFAMLGKHEHRQKRSFSEFGRALFQSCRKWFLPLVMSLVTLLNFLDKFFNSFNFRGRPYEEERIDWSDGKRNVAFIATTVLVLLPFITIESFQDDKWSVQHTGLYFRYIVPLRNSLSFMVSDSSDDNVESPKLEDEPEYSNKVWKERARWLNAATGSALLVCVMFLEDLFNRKQCFVTYFASAIAFRVFYNQTFFDNFALCVAFTSNVGAVSSQQSLWYLSANILLWSYFVVALLLRHVYDRINNRISENLRVLFLLHVSLDHEQHSHKRLYDAHIPNFSIKPIPEYSIYKSSAPQTPSKQKHEDAPRVSSFDYINDTEVNFPAATNADSRLYREAIQLGLLSATHDDRTIDFSSLPVIEKKDVVLIAIRLSKSFEQECILAIERRQVLHDTVSLHAEQFGIVSVRCFGDTWIGYLERKPPTWSHINKTESLVSSTPRVSTTTDGATTARPADGSYLSIAMQPQRYRYYSSAHAALSFCCQIRSILATLGNRATIAIDQCSIPMGFDSKSSQFNMYGTEIRILLRVIDLEDYGHINVTETFKQQISDDRRLSPEIENIAIDRRQVQFPWKKGFFAPVMTVNNPNDYLPSSDELDLIFRTITRRISSSRLETFSDGILKLRLEEVDSTNYFKSLRTEDIYSQKRMSVFSLLSSSDSPSTSGQLFDGYNGSFFSKYSDMRNESTTTMYDSWGYILSRPSLLMSVVQENVAGLFWLWFEEVESSEYWKESIGKEFKESVKERTTISFCDPVVKSIPKAVVLSFLSSTLSDLYWLTIASWFWSIWYYPSSLVTFVSQKTTMVSIATPIHSEPVDPAATSKLSFESTEGPFDSPLRDFSSDNSWIKNVLKEQWLEIRYSRVMKAVISSILYFADICAWSWRRLLGVAVRPVAGHAKIVSGLDDKSLDDSSSIERSQRSVDKSHRSKPSIRVSAGGSNNNSKRYSTELNAFAPSVVDTVKEEGEETELWQESKSPSQNVPTRKVEIKITTIPITPLHSPVESVVAGPPQVGEQNSLATTQQQLVQDIPPRNSPQVRVDSQETLATLDRTDSLMLFKEETFYETGEIPTLRKYGRDIRMLVLHDMFSMGIELFVLVVALYPVYGVLSRQQQDAENIGFRFLVFLHFIYIQSFERMFERFHTIIALVYHVLMMLLFPCCVLRSGYDLVFRKYGDFGGDVFVTIFLLVRIPSSMRMHPLIVLLEGFLIRGVLTWKDRFVSSSCHMQIPARNQTMIIFGIVFVIFSILYFITFASYLLEHKILPTELHKLKRARKRTKDLTRHFYPETHSYMSTLSQSSLYQNVTLLCIHVKAIDAICEFVESDDVGNFAATINAIMDSSFDECGLVKITEFSGVYIVATARSLGISKQESGLSRTNTYSIVHAIGRIRSKVDDFTKRYQFNIALGISLHAGDVYVGYNGFNRYCLDVVGSARDIIVAMASHNSEGLFASRIFESEIQRLKPVDYLVHQQTITQNCWGESYWLCVDGTLAGMHLDDFLWLGKLGEGGYGMVHLAAEKHSKVRYAIKVIPLKHTNGSRVTKMVKRECIILQKMAHKNVVKLHYSFISREQLYLVMTYVKGGNLKYLIDNAEYSFSVSQLKYWFAELVLAIDYIHYMGIIHRDIKPANCMIGKS